MVAYDEMGEGPPIVLIHGLATTREIWRHVAPLLATQYRVITVDVPGFGNSPPAGAGFALDAVAEAIWTGLPDDAPVTLVGHSMGGAVTLVAATERPERVDRLVLCAPAGLHPLPHTASNILAPAGELALDLRRRAVSLAATPAGRRILLGIGVAGGDRITEADVTRMVTAAQTATRTADALRTITSIDLGPLLPRAPRRLGLLWGERDLVIRRAVIDDIREARPDIPVEIVPGTGHIPMMERPLAFTATLRQLIARIDAVPEPHSTDA